MEARETLGRSARAIASMVDGMSAKAPLFLALLAVFHRAATAV